MKTRGSHTGKSARERDYYTRQIRHIDSEPTVDDTLDFPETDDAKRDYSVPTSKSRRPNPWTQQISDHLHDNWIPWAIAIALVVFTFFMIESKISLASIATKLDLVREDVGELKKTDKETQEKIHQQDLKIQENRIRVETVEKNQPKTKSSK